jgi:Ca-activated chloride channel family protein
MHRLFLCFILLAASALPFSAAAQSAQENVSGRLISKDTTRLSVMQLSPDSFPLVSVVFQARTKSGRPVWNLRKDNVGIEENGKACTVSSIEKISRNKAVNVALVVDHSGSMGPTLWQVLNDTIELENLDDSNMPIGKARAALKKLVSGWNFNKDSIAIVGFSDYSDINYPLSNNKAGLLRTINKLKAIGGTALYDGLLKGLNTLNANSGMNAVIALTDGRDNESRHGLRYVIRKAKKLNIPVYMIGLGDVDETILSKIASETGGQFYHTDSASSLSAIYDAISKNILAVYELKYISRNLASSDTSKEIKISFQNDSLFVTDNAKKFTLSPEVVQRLKEDEQKAEARQQQTLSQTNTEHSYVLFGGIAGLVLAGGGAVGFTYTRRIRRLKFNKASQPQLDIHVYPNPATDYAKIGMKLPENFTNGTLSMHDLNGNALSSQSLTQESGEITLDVSQYPSGTYLIKVAADRIQAVKKIIIMH